MIIEGAPAGSVSFWTKHLQRTDTNDEVHIREVRGTLAEDLEEALREMQAVAAGSRSQGNFMYQANINPRADERLTPEQWREAVDTLEKNLGLEDHQRVVIEHVKEGRQHYHVIWNRVDVDTMLVRDMGGNYYTHERTARQLEQAFGLERTPRVHGEREGDRLSKRTDLWEYDRGHETGQSPREIKAELTTLWHAAGNGPLFVEALERHGYILARGDRRDFCIIDRAGDEHSLARRLDGVTARQLRATLAFLDRTALPSVDEAKAIYEERRAERVTEQQRRAGLDEEGRIRTQTEWGDRVSQAAIDAAKAKDRADSRPSVAPTRRAEAQPVQDNNREEARAERLQKPSREGAHNAPKEEQSRGPTAKAVSDGVKVFDRVTNVVSTLADFVANLLTSFVAPERPQRTVFEQIDQDPAERVTAITARRRADAALQSIADDLRHGPYVKADDIRNLTPADLQNIRDTGDAELLAMIRRMEEDRERQRDPGRGRER